LGLINLIHTLPMTYHSWHGITMETHNFLTYEYLHMDMHTFIHASIA